MNILRFDPTDFGSTRTIFGIERVREPQSWC